MQNYHHSRRAARVGNGELSSLAGHKCPFILIGPQSINRLSVIENGSVVPFGFNKFASCVANSKGYHTGFDERIRKQSLVDAVTFLRKVFE